MPQIAPLRGLRPAASVDLRAATWRLGAAPALDAAWIRGKTAQGLLVRDRSPAFYHYELSFGPPEARRHATGFLARVALHEGDTGGDPSPRAAAGHDLEPAVFRYSDERGWVDEVLSSNAFDEVARFTDADGNEHRLWRVERGEGVGEVVAQFEDRALRLERGEDLLRAARAHWRGTGRDADGAVLALLAPEGPEAAPWRGGLVFSPLDEGRPRPWTEVAGDPGKAQWRTPALG
ncbi:MAG: hypothetical protein ABR562_02440 [Thermoplasmatota archaeon]|nr:DUF1015 domain-containing protein [Halobacteriales archaeon]